MLRLPGFCVHNVLNRYQPQLPVFHGLIYQSLWLAWVNGAVKNSAEVHIVVPHTSQWAANTVAAQLKTICQRSVKAVVACRCLPDISKGLVVKGRDGAIRSCSCCI